MLMVAANATSLASSAATELQAFDDGTLGVSFGIAGFLVGYLAGAAYLLAELGIITSNTRIAGASSGALLSMALCSGIPPEQFSQILQRLCNTCRQKSNCQGHLHAAVQTAANEILPPNAYKRCNNKVFMSITTGRFGVAAPPNQLIGSFSSNADMAAAATTSSYIPFWSGSQPTTTFRGYSAYDGFFSDAQPCPPGVKACVKISSRNPPWTNKQLEPFFQVMSRNVAVNPVRPSKLVSLPPGATTNLAPTLSPAEARRQANALGVDIAPGLYTPMTMPGNTWDDYLVLAGDQAVNDHLWKLGRRDAAIWARATGLDVAAAAARAQGGKVYESLG